MATILTVGRKKFPRSALLGFKKVFGFFVQAVLVKFAIVEKKVINIFYTWNRTDLGYLP